MSRWQSLANATGLANEAWLLTGNRPGEIAQQRIVGAQLNIPVREIQVARMAPSGRQVTFDFSAMQPPWPRMAISFGKTLVAARHLRNFSQGRTRLVHLGLPRRTPSRMIDLIVPMPTDRYIDAPNVLRIRMPLNLPARAAREVSACAQRLRATALPRPWTVLIIGGDTKRSRAGLRDIAEIVQAANSRALRRGGSLLVSTSPRTPQAAVSRIASALTAPGELYVFGNSSGIDNPLGAYLELADDLIVTADSASMIAECWRTGHPVWVAAARQSWRGRLRRAFHSAVPRILIRSGLIAGDVDIGRWMNDLVRSGRVGLLGISDPVEKYCPDKDDDLHRVISRVRRMLEAPS